VAEGRDSGSILDGKYEIVERLATGGMGEVYRARHVHLHEDRVVKILRGDKATDPQAVQRFSQEARIATQIKHPNVATLYDFSRLPDGSFYMIWEHIGGEDVGSILKARGPFDVAAAVELGVQVLRGLDAIHSAGVIHRDISPDNLMITRDRRDKPLVKIIDLGLAKNLETETGSEITQAGMFMGKLMYCSPEQAGSNPGAALDHRSDLYSFALVLYEMVVGKLPFESENPHGFALKKLSDEPLPLAGRVDGIRIPSSLDEVVMRALARDREARWPDALAFLRALVRVAEQLRRVATQEIPVGGKAPAAGPSSSPRPGARATPSELSREERVALLAQIDRAARRVSEAGKIHDEAKRALEDRRFDDALEAIDRLESVSPRHASILGLRSAVAAGRRGEGPPTRAVEPAPAAATPERQVPTVEEEERRARIAETEKMLETYLRDHKQSLARFALDTLLDIAPNHPRRSDYESWVQLMGEEEEAFRAAQEALERGRVAISGGDLDEARQALAEVERVDPSNRLGDLLRGEIEEAAVRQRAGAALDERRERLEELIEGRRVADAERELKRLAESGLAKVSIDGYRLRIADLVSMAEREKRAVAFAERCQEAIRRRDWADAREVVYELEREIPDSPRVAQLFAEIARQEEVSRRQAGVDQGVQQLEAFLGAGRRAEAETALKILQQMAPDHPQLASLETRVRALQGS